MKKNHRLNTHSGFAMPSVLFLIAVGSVFMMLIFNQIVSHNRYVSRYQTKTRLKYIAEGGLYKALWQIRQDGFTDIDDLVVNIIPDTCWVQVKRQDFFLNLVSTAKINDEEIKLTALLGYNAGSLFKPAMSVYGPLSVFVFSRFLHINGDVSLSATDIHYSPPDVEDVKFIEGKMIVDENQTLLPIYSTYIDSIFNITTSEIEHYNRSEYLLLKSRKISSTELENKNTYIENECTISSEIGLEEIKGPGKIISKNGLTFIGGSNFKGTWEIITGGDVFIKDSVRFEDVNIFSRSGVYFENNSSAKGTFISAKQITATNSTELEYPSYFLVKKNDNKPSGVPEIAILQYSDFSGAIILYDDFNGNPKNQLSNRYGKVTINTAVPVKGGIYSSGAIELYGNIAGFVVGSTIEQQIKETRWINYLENVQIDRYASTLNLPLPLCFTPSNFLELLEISEIRNDHFN